MFAFVPRCLTAVCVTVLAGLAAVVVPVAGASESSEPGQLAQGQDGGRQALTATPLLAGRSLSHTFTVAGTSTPASGQLTDPDDITRLGQNIFVGFQNGVGPQGEPSSGGNLDSTVVEVTPGGHVVAQWDIAGKTDGVTADPYIHAIVATVNEDANSSLWVITPGPGGGVHHYAFSEPLPHNGGTDAISVVNGQLYVSASAPGTTGTLAAPQASFPAVYTVTLDPIQSIATVTPLFYDEDAAKVANLETPQSGQTVSLALTDPDSNGVVPNEAPRFGGDFMLTSQGDLQQIYVSPWDHRLSVLNLSQSVDDTAWPDDGGGLLYATDSTNDRVDVISGHFPDAPVVAATPCGANAAPATCPSPPQFPSNYLGTLNPWTGEVAALAIGGAPFVPQGGLLFTGDHRDEH